MKYVTVPVTPTDEMLQAASECAEDWPEQHWEAMIKAAPANQPKTPGAMVLVPREPTRDMLCSGWTSVLGKLDHESIAQLWQAMINIAPAEQPSAVIDLDDEDWKAIQQAAAESKWMPVEYMRNEWVSDVCSFLRDPRVAEQPPAVIEGEERDQLVTELASFMNGLSGGLRHFAAAIIDAGWVKSRAVVGGVEYPVLAHLYSDGSPLMLTEACVAKAAGKDGIELIDRAHTTSLLAKIYELEDLIESMKNA